MAAFDNMLFKSTKLDQITIEMFISELKKEESSLNVRFRGYKNYHAKNEHFKMFCKIFGMSSR